MAYYCPIDKNRGFDYSIPIKAVEYMLAGIPVVGSKDGGMLELLGNDYPFLVNPHHTKEIVSAIKQIHSNKDVAQKWIEKSKKKASKLLTELVFVYQSA